jgi:hypothetical protein
MNYRDVVNNIISDAKLLTKMTARQSSIFRRKIYGRILAATETEEMHKEIPYPNKKRKIIDKDHNIGSLLVLYKGLMEKYTTFTNRSKIILKKNYELEAELKKANDQLFYTRIAILLYQLILLGILLSILWMDDVTFKFYQRQYENYKKFWIDIIYLWGAFIVEHYLVPFFKIAAPSLKHGFTFVLHTYLFPFFEFLMCSLHLIVAILLEDYLIPCFNFIFPCYNLTALAY